MKNAYGYITSVTINSVATWAGSVTANCTAHCSNGAHINFGTKCHIARLPPLPSLQEGAWRFGPAQVDSVPGSQLGEMRGAELTSGNMELLEVTWPYAHRVTDFFEKACTAKFGNLATMLDAALASTAAVLSAADFAEAATHATHWRVENRVALAGVKAKAAEFAKQMTKPQALLGVLVLALTADTDQNAAKAVALAADISVGLSAAEIEQCKATAIEIKNLADKILRDRDATDIHVICAELTQHYQCKLGQKEASELA